MAIYEKRGPGGQFIANGGDINNNSGTSPQIVRPVFNGPVSIGNSQSKTPLQTRCLQSLAFPEMGNRSKEIDDVADGTCEWLLKHGVYKTWAAQDRALLSIKGKPGSGKSTLLRYALKNLKKTHDNGDNKTIFLSFFFHGRGTELQKTPLGFFLSLLHQLLNQVPEALSGLLNAFEEQCRSMGKPGEGWQWHPTDLQEFFESSLPVALESRPVWLFVDALDECGEEHVGDLVDNFKSWLEGLPSTSQQFHVCFTRRHYPNLNLEHWSEISVDEHNENDISIFVRTKLSTRPTIPPEIPKMITDGASGVFMWARLVVKRVLDLELQGAGWKKVKKEISSIPPELDYIYNGLFCGMDDKLASLNLFKWICFAARPLSLDELRWIMVIDSDIDSPHRSLEESQLAGDYAPNNEIMEKRVKTLSRGVAEVVVTSDAQFVQFIHQSAKDFFIKKGQSILDRSQISEGDATGRAHYELSRSCIRYLAMEEISQSTTWDGDRLKSEFPLLKYAAGSWVSHACQSETRGISQDDLLDYFKWPSQDLVEVWLRAGDKVGRSACIPMVGTALEHILSNYGLKGPLLETMRRADRAGTDLNVRDVFRRTPLFNAVAMSHEDIVKLLLDTDKVDANPKDFSGRTPFSWAVWRGQKAMVKLLLNFNQVDVNITDNRGQTPLHLAIAERQEAIVELLCNNNKVDVNTTDDSGQTPLHLAIQKGRYDMMKLILKMDGININAEDSKGRTVLHLALTTTGDKDIIKLLREADAN